MSELYELRAEANRATPAKAETWQKTQKQFIEENMPPNAMGGGAPERILARQHAIAITHALADNQPVEESRVREMAEFFNSTTSDFPADILKRYPFLDRAKRFHGIQ